MLQIDIFLLELKTFGGIGSKHQHLIKFNIQQAKGLDIN